MGSSTSRICSNLFFLLSICGQQPVFHSDRNSSDSEVSGSPLQKEVTSRSQNMFLAKRLQCKSRQSSTQHRTTCPRAPLLSPSFSATRPPAAGIMITLQLCSRLFFRDSPPRFATLSCVVRLSDLAYKLSAVAACSWEAFLTQSIEFSSGLQVCHLRREKKAIITCK